MQGIELRREAKPVVRAALEQGLVLNATAVRVLRFLPPLTITIDEIDEGMTKLAAALEATAA
jgi:acetylornithine/succinyldiaminopimelate/putrescine aminotransferase